MDYISFKRHIGLIVKKKRLAQCGSGFSNLKLLENTSR